MIYDPRTSVKKVYNFKSWLSTLSLAFILYVISRNNFSNWDQGKMHKFGKGPNEYRVTQINYTTENLLAR